MTVHTAPQPLPDPDTRSLFVAGGISNCPDWQRELISSLTASHVGADLFNPRREDYPDRETEAIRQIEWEFNALNQADAVLFWFPKETLCPITLLELGRFTHDKKTIFVGTHPEYQRKLDVITQLRLARPEIEVVHSLESLAGQILVWDNSQLS
jgi:hypothetical protein